MAEIPKSYKAGKHLTIQKPRLRQSQSSYRGSSGTSRTPVAYVHATRSGSLLMVAFSTYTTVTITPPANWVSLGTSIDGTGSEIQVFGYPNAPVFAANASPAAFTFSSSVTIAEIVMEWEGIATASVVDASNANYGQQTATATFGPILLSVQPTNYTDFFLAFIAAHSQVTPASSPTTSYVIEPEWTQEVTNVAATVSTTNLWIESLWVPGTSVPEELSIMTDNQAASLTNHGLVLALKTLQAADVEDDISVLTVPANKALILRSIRLVNGSEDRAGKATLYVATREKALVDEVPVPPGGVLTLTGYNVLAAGEQLFAILEDAYDQAVYVSGIEVDV